MRAVSGVVDTLAGQAALRASLVTLAALVLTGAGTAAVLHFRAVRSLDEMLLVAATEGAHPPAWEAEGYSSPIDVRVERVGRGDGEGHRGDSEGPRFYDEGDVRGVELPVEGAFEGAPVEGEPVEGEAEQHLLVYAEAHRVRFADSAVPFLAPFAAVGILVAVLAGLAQARGMADALGPLARAARDASAITALGGGARLAEEGPREIRNMISAINALLGRLEAAFSAQPRFTGEAAHELRTPVAGLRGQLEVALRRPRTAEEYQSAISAALKQADRLGSLVDGLLMMARVDAGQADFGRESEHAAILAQRAASQEKEGLDEAGCALDLDVRADPEVHAHASLVTAAISNLLRNAARHAPGSAVTLRVEARGDLVAFVVDAGGPGVPKGEREEVYSRLAQGAAAREANRAGLGLGLPLARAVARRHGGDCWLEERPGGGCRAILTIGT